MRIRTILAAAAAPAALAAVLLGTAGQASAATVASSSDASAYFYNPSGNALGGPQPMGQFVTDGGQGATIQFQPRGYLAKVTEKVNNLDIRGKTITVTGHLNPATYQYQNETRDVANGAPTDVYARIYFDGSSGGVSDQSPQGYLGQPWWSHDTATEQAVLHLNTQSGDFTLTAKVPVDPTSDPNVWTNWNGKDAAQNADLFNGAASHVREVGLSFGGGWFNENGVTGSGNITINSINVGS
jgi:hypothetical protein